MASGNGNTTYDMTDIYKQKLHSPRDKAGNIYYTTKEDLEVGNIQNGANIRNWMFDPRTVCNSPTNIRRIWFSAKNIIVEYYAAPKRGVDDKGVERRGKLVEVRNLGGIDFRIKAKELLRLKSLGDQAREAVKKGYMRDIEITGNPLMSKGNYALNNVEEIYFDWTALASKNTEELYYSAMGSRLNIISTYLNNGRILNGGAGGELSTSIPLDLFMGGKVALGRNYARLRKIVMISNLQDIIDKYMTEDTVGRHVDTFDVNHVTEFSTSWMDRPDIKEAIAGTNSDVLISFIKGAENANRKNIKEQTGKESKTYFVVKSSTFLFDELVLGPKIDKYTSTVEEHINNKYSDEINKKKADEEAKETAEAEARAEKDAEIERNGPQEGSIYELMELIKNTGGIETAKIAFAATTYALKDNEVKMLLASMPTDMQKMYNTARINMKNKVDVR